MEELGRPRRLITLQMPDQMPSSIQVLQTALFPFQLLYAVFSKVPQPRRISLSNRVGRMSL